MKHIVEVDVEDGQIVKVTHIHKYIPIRHSASKEVEEDEYGAGKTHHRCWRVSEEILILEDKE